VPQCFAKLNCNKYNKSLGVELGVKVAPTFQLYKNSVKVAEMTGAKIDALKDLVATHK
jgi:thioredoxin 1